MIDAVEGAMRGQCFFIAVQPNTSLYSIGFGTHALKPGDKVLPFADGYHPSDIDRQGGFQALLLRSSPSTTGGSKTFPCLAMDINYKKSIAKMLKSSIFS
jgi:hypothetical protein